MEEGSGVGRRLPDKQCAIGTLATVVIIRPGWLHESIAQLVERLPYKQEVGGSSPSILTRAAIKVAQLI